MANPGVVTKKVPRDIENNEEGCFYAIAKTVGIQGI
jgi:hypothetical protein